jgi:hypothetical protein
MNHRARPLPACWPTRRAFVPQGCDQQGREEPTIQPAPAEACTEVGQDDGEPLTRGEAIRFWAFVCAPGFVGVIGFAVLIWCAKP